MGTASDTPASLGGWFAAEVEFQSVENRNRGHDNQCQHPHIGEQTHGDGTALVGKALQGRMDTCRLWVVRNQN